MSLRDYFAAKALEGMNANPELMQNMTQGDRTVGWWISNFEKMAKKAYEQADAMLKARES